MNEQHPRAGFVARPAFFVLCLSLCLFFLGTLSRTAWADVIGTSGPHTSSVENSAVDIEVFVRDGCPHCNNAKVFLNNLVQQRPGLRVRFRDVNREPGALNDLMTATERLNQGPARVPAFLIGDQLIVGFADAGTTGRLIIDLLQARKPNTATDAGSCEAPSTPEPTECGPPALSSATESFELSWFGRSLNLQEVGLPLFTLAMGLLDGFNPCSLWVLILMISLLAPMQDRWRMAAVAGTFVAVEGIAYFVFMAAWLNLFLLIGFSRLSQIIIAVIALVAGAINLKDFVAYGWGGISLSIPQSAKPGIYSRMREILQARSTLAAMVGAVVLAILVQIVELFCTSGFPALYTRILTLRQLSDWEYYGYLLLYNTAYMFDDVVILAVGIITLSQKRLQEREGRLMKLISGLVMVLLGVYLLVNA